MSTDINTEPLTQKAKDDLLRTATLSRISIPEIAEKSGVDARAIARWIAHPRMAPLDDDQTRALIAFSW
jgi:hypothetical protein